MKTKQQLIAPVSVATARSSSLNQRGKDEEAARLQRQRNAQPQCERERRHEAARREREEQTQLTSLLRRQETARKSSQPLRRPSRERDQRQLVNSSAKVAVTMGKTVPTVAKTVPAVTLTAHKAAATASKAFSATTKSAPNSVENAASSISSCSSSSKNEETAQLKLQLEHLTKLSEQDFEREFRKWIIKEAIDGKLQPQLRTDLVKSFNNITLGQLLNKSSTSASATRTSQQPHCLLLSPLALALHTLVAEFLYAQNCSCTLSMFCSEMPHRHTLPDFESRTEFRFSQDELQQVLTAVLGTQDEHFKIGQLIVQQYSKPEQSLLLALVSALIDGRAKETTLVSASTATDCPTGQPTGFDGEHVVFVGPRIGHSLNSVDQQLGQLMNSLKSLSKACAPPVEVISAMALDQLVQRELDERERLTSAGKTYPLEQTVIKLSEHTGQSKTQVQAAKPKETTVNSPYGAIQLPATSPVVPQVPQLHEQQVASIVTVQQTLQQLSKKLQLPHECMIMELQRLETMIGQLANCLQSLSNVLNLAMEQEYAVGRNRGYKLGYREGFNHGHFMGVQEGEQLAAHKHQQQQQEKQQEQPKPLLQHASSQTEVVNVQTTATQMRRKVQRPVPAEAGAIATQDVGIQCNSAEQQARIQRCETAARRDANSQTYAERAAASDACVQTAAACTAAVPPVERSYEQWIYEMLHSQSGSIFLERVELSLNKALEMQKRRLDELFEVKQRHHGELIRLNRRQKSWRTLCKHVARDTESKEANELAQRIFRLLEHYEAHHKLLSEKLQETELAAEQTSRIEPVWNDSMGSGTVSGSVASSQPSLARTTPEPAHPQPTGSLLALALAPAPAAPAAPAAQATAAAAAPARSLAPEPAVQPAPATSEPPVLQAAKPVTRSVATNTVKSSQLPAAAQAKAASSFTEALLSAKTRMLQLEQESTLLEQSFLGYLERARAQNYKFNIRASCARERQQLHRTLDSFREWQRRIQRDDVLQQHSSTHSMPLAVSPVCSAAELEPESSQFTNAIAKARQKLLAELHVPAMAPAAAVELSDVSNGGSDTDKLLMDQMQLETQQLLSRMEATLARAVKPTSLPSLPSMQSHDEPLLDMDALSSVTASSLTSIDCGAGGDDGGVTRKLQRSMNKMQRLFGSDGEPAATAVGKKSAAYAPLRMPATRPWSAPISKLSQAACLPALLQPPRPHTAPSSRTSVPAGVPAAPATNLIHMLDALSDVGDSTIYTSSQASSLDISSRSTGALPDVYAQLVANATTPSPSPSHASSSATLSHSLEFWKRMNL